MTSFILSSMRYRPDLVLYLTHTLILSPLSHHRLEEGPHRSKICREVQEVADEIIQSAEQVLKSMKKIVLIIATDVIPEDGDILETLKTLDNLPVIVVIRLCTGKQRKNRRTDTHTHRQTDAQTHRHIHTDTETDTQTDRHTDTQTHIHTDIHTHRQRHRHTLRQRHRHIDRYTD